MANKKAARKKSKTMASKEVGKAHPQDQEWNTAERQERDREIAEAGHRDRIVHSPQERVEGAGQEEDQVGTNRGREGDRRTALRILFAE